VGETLTRRKKGTMPRDTIPRRSVIAPTVYRRRLCPFSFGVPGSQMTVSNNYAEMRLHVILAIDAFIWASRVNSVQILQQ
jgi:hypothetical protein